MMNEWIAAIIDEITIEDLPESYREVARAIGVENAVKLSSVVGGLGYYFPQLDGILRKKRDECIRREFNGNNHRELAKKFDLTERWVREIVEEKTPQTPLFDISSL